MWGKGYNDLLERLKEAKERGKVFQLDSFGSGEDEAEASTTSSPDLNLTSSDSCDSHLHCCSSGCKHVRPVYERQ